MEIPVINRIGDFEAGITSLQNPSFPSQVFALSRVEKIHQAYSFCKWGALIVALVASFSTIINRIKILIIRIQNHYLIPSQPPLSADEDFDYSSETDTSCSSVSEDDDYDEEEEEYEPGSSSSQGWRYIDDDFSVRGSGHYTDDQWHNRNLRRRRNSSLEDLFSSWSEFSNGKNVVKLWDNLGFGFGLNLDNQSRNCISVCDMNKEVNVFPFRREKRDSGLFHVFFIAGSDRIRGNNRVRTLAEGVGHAGRESDTRNTRRVEAEVGKICRKKCWRRGEGLRQG
ncbi:hypothetical protein GH714_019326 [Hevea brasiliensis]|uniref:Uncharacterized protein n=1 Tax=Hevea brasiliensis TaxID=3981 RepID=A0A6A6MBD9_HEVBR|nr:hypothetical protein GH714_019326 [Hevea brasiliensis]